MRFAVDTGGTFTDLLVEEDDGVLHMYKTPTTPGDPVAGVLAAFDLAAADRGIESRALLERGELFIHGTTIATNAVLTGRTARTAFLTTRGHPEILVFREAGRMGLPMFDYGVSYPEPYVPRALTFEVPERIGADGRVLERLDEAALLALVPVLVARGVQAVGVCLLWSIANPAHERRIGELLAEHLPGVAVSLSHAVNPSIREYRRASATCIDASLKPLVGPYLESMAARLRGAGFAGDVLVVTSQGGVMDARDIARAPIHAVKSGPAMAPVAGRAYAVAEGGGDTAIVADTGGTSYDVSLVRRGRIPWTRETWLGPPYRGHMTGFPSVD
ncbi:MAG TPA: hydantoinase/oxoprolinase family protein, partial [Candidatus Methylomirabilis sp.]|nr:hydantoinase/oxoprolinase family protein [Candidatus Methylomirabilis sp.]